MTARPRRRAVVGLAAGSMLALASLLAAACWQPAFDPALSASSITASRMTLVATISIADMPERVSSPGVFLPRRVAAPADGAWINGAGTDGYEFESANAWYLGAASTADLFYDWSNAVHYAANPSGPPVARIPPGLQATDALEMITAGFWSEYGYNAWAAGRLYQRADKPVAMAADPASPTLPGGSRLLAAGMTSETAALDTMCLVYFEPSLAAWYVGELPIPFPLPAIDSQPLTMPSGFDASDTRGVGFAARKGADYYLSVTDDYGAARAFRWSGGPASEPTEMTGVAAPLIAVLFDGTLLSGDGMTMTAHAADGAALFSFPAGSLRFVHERYDAVNEIWQAVFTRTMFIRDRNDDRGEFRAEVYETSSGLSALAP